MPPALITLAHQGSKIYSETYDLIYRREASRPNQIWQADHTPLDILVYNEADQPAKPWLTLIQDDYSRCVCGYYLSFHAPCIMHTALALRQAIWRKKDTAWQVCGIPEILYTDHGSDFTSLHMEQVCADLKIELKFSIPGKPQGRGRIERLFSAVNQLLLMQLPGYAPNGSQPAKPALNLQEFSQAFEKFVVHQYHHRVHHATGMAPLERWTGQGFLPQLPASLEQLDLLLLTVAKPRSIHRDGIRFQGLRYIDPVMASYVGEKVTIRYDPRDMAEIRIYHQNEFLCRAVCQEIAGETVSLKDIIKARGKRKKQLQQIIAQRRSLLDTLLTVSESSQTQAMADQGSEPLQKSSHKIGHGLKLYHNQ